MNNERKGISAVSALQRKILTGELWFKLSDIEEAIRDYGKRFWAKEQAERIIEHIREAINSTPKTRGK